MDTKGGRYTITIGGVRYAGRGKASIKPARATPKAGANRDMSAYRTVDTKLAEISLQLDRGPKAQRLTWTEDMLLQDIDVTFREDDAGVTHYLTAGSWEGDPEIDTDDGSVSGMMVKSDQYRATSN